MYFRLLSAVVIFTLIFLFGILSFNFYYKERTSQKIIQANPSHKLNVDDLMQNAPDNVKEYYLKGLLQSLGWRPENCYVFLGKLLFSQDDKIYSYDGHKIRFERDASDDKSSSRLNFLLNKLKKMGHHVESVSIFIEEDIFFNEDGLNCGFDGRRLYGCTPIKK